MTGFPPRELVELPDPLLDIVLGEGYYGLVALKVAGDDEDASSSVCVIYEGTGRHDF